MLSVQVQTKPVQFDVGSKPRLTVSVVKGRASGIIYHGVTVYLLALSVLFVYYCLLACQPMKGLDTCCSVAYMSQTRERFTISEVAADWHEPTVLQRIMWPSVACANGQLDARCS